MNLDSLPVKELRATLVVIIARRMAGRLAAIIPTFADLRLHLAARQDVSAAGLAQIEEELEFLAEDAKLLSGG